MDVLIDTQILIWSFDNNSPLTKKHKALLEDPSNRILISQISLMELAIKKNINKLPDFVLDIQTVNNQIKRNGFELLELSNDHIYTYQNLPLFGEHKDPFDRFIIAVAIKENLPIVTSDVKFNLYSALIQVI